MKRIVILWSYLLLYTSIFAQLSDKEADIIGEMDQQIQRMDDVIKTLQKFNVSGYIQTQYQYAEVDADGTYFKLANRANAYEVNELKGYGRFGIRRGRIKFTYEDGLVQGVFQPDITERGVSVKDVYLAVKDPLFETNVLYAGIFNRPFGHEVAWSSSRRESPERARIIQSIFPDERDLGVMLTLQPAKTSKLNRLKLDAGLFAGNGIRPQISTRMDFIGRLSFTQLIGYDMQLGLGVSAYSGGVLQTDSQRYVMRDKQFVLESNAPGNKGRYAKRRYFGFDIQFSMVTAAGFTQVRGEYIAGEHPGNANSAYDFKPDALQSGPVYMRKISGGYVILAQDFGTTPFTFVGKFDRYNPNTEVSGNDIGTADTRTGAGDIARSTIGLGLLWRISPALRMTAYYDIVKNETTNQLKDTTDEFGKITRYGYEGQRKENVFTLRLQYRF